MSAFGTAGGVDTAELFGSDVKDYFKATADYSMLYGGTFLNRAVDFEQVHAYGADGPDAATLFDAVIQGDLTAECVPDGIESIVCLHEFQRINQIDTQDSSKSSVIRALDEVFTALWE